MSDTQRRRLPTFVGIGAQKSGTTWLHRQLDAHPELFVPPTKELNFFYSARDRQWYEEQFALAGTDQICGEISPNYMVLPGVAERLFELLPDVKLLIILRNPTQRAFSQWKMATRLGNMPPDGRFIDAFRENLQYMRVRGEYARVLEPFLRHCPPPERSLILLYDEIVEEPALFLRRVFRFLGVCEDFRPPAMHDVVAASDRARRIGPEDAAELAEYYRPHVRELSALLGRSLASWNGLSAGIS